METDKTQWNYFPHLQTAEEINNYFDVRLKGHTEFFHYTSLNAIDKILEGKLLRISCVERFNDKKDKEQFGTVAEQKKHFSICFSTGSNENLSLWYLYSGIDGKGGRIGFTYSQLSKLIDTGEFYLTEYDYESNRCIGLEIPLIKGENAEFIFRDVLYERCPENSRFADLKYNTMTNHGNVSVEECEKYKKEHVGFSKKLIWYYEKESRLLINLKGAAADLIKTDKDYTVMWDIGSQINNMKIKCAPEIENFSEAESKPHIKAFIFKTSRVDLSENKGDIEMKLCSKCDYKKACCSDENKNKPEADKKEIKK